MQTRHQGPHIYSSALIHAIDVDKASIMPQNGCVPDCTIDVEDREIFIPSILGLFDILD